MRTLTFGLTAFAIALVACSDAAIDAPPTVNGAGTMPSGTGDDGGSSSSIKRDAASGDDDDSDASSTFSGDDASDSGSSTTPPVNDAGKPVDSGAPAKDSGVDSGSSSGDGTPMRQTCTNNYGSALTGTFGRLDGYVVAVVLPGGSKCNADSTHIHIQVLMNNDVYDVAVNVDGGYWLDSNFDLPSGAWSEGWHGSDGLNYVALGAHSSDFASISQSALVTQLENALASANHITAYGMTYTGTDSGTGIHDIHRESTNRDGALFLDPTSATPRSLLFRFSSDSF